MVQIQVDSRVAEQLAEQARARGLSLAEFLARIARNGSDAPISAPAHANGSSIERVEPARDDWIERYDRMIAGMRGLTKAKRPGGGFVDDSRDSIYGGPEDRGE